MEKDEERMEAIKQHDHDDIKMYTQYNMNMKHNKQNTQFNWFYTA